MLFGEGRRGTIRLQAPPDSGQPTHHGDPAPTWGIVQHPAAAAMTDRNHPAPGAAVLDLIGLDRHHQPLLLVDSDIEDVHAGNIEHRIGPGAPAHTRATHTVGHRRGLRREAWSLLILKAPTPSTRDQHAQLARHSPMPICEEPVLGVFQA